MSDNDELDDFFLGGGDELMNSEQCPACGASIYLDRPIEWVDEEIHKVIHKRVEI
jgi:hypothetical protein